MSTYVTCVHTMAHNNPKKITNTMKTATGTRLTTTQKKHPSLKQRRNPFPAFFWQEVNNGTYRRIVYTYRTRSRHSSGRSSYRGIFLSSLPRTWLIDRYRRWSIISWSLSWRLDLYSVLVCNLSNSIDGTNMQVKNRTLHVCSHKRYINTFWYYRFTYFILWHMALYYVSVW